MTEHLFPPEFAEKLDPKLIIPGVIFLASEKAPNGEILEVGGGVVANTYVMETMGSILVPMKISLLSLSQNIGQKLLIHQMLRDLFKVVISH